LCEFTEIIKCGVGRVLAPHLLPLLLLLLLLQTIRMKTHNNA
jgi:hypothetical protein